MGTSRFEHCPYPPPPPPPPVFPCIHSEVRINHARIQQGHPNRYDLHLPPAHFDATAQHNIGSSGIQHLSGQTMLFKTMPCQNDTLFRVLFGGTTGVDSLAHVHNKRCSPCQTVIVTNTRPPVFKAAPSPRWDASINQRCAKSQCLNAFEALRSVMTMTLTINNHVWAHEDSHMIDNTGPRTASSQNETEPFHRVTRLPWNVMINVCN